MRSLNQDHIPFGATRPAAAQSCQPQTAVGEHSRYSQLTQYWGSHVKMFHFAINSHFFGKENACSHLNDDEQTDSCTHLWGISIHAGHHIHNGLSNGNDHSKHWKTLTVVRQSMGIIYQRHVHNPALDESLLTFLSSIEECSVLRCVSNFNDLSSSKQLHYQAWGDNRRDTQLHQGTWREIFRLGDTSKKEHVHLIFYSVIS